MPTPRSSWRSRSLATALVVVLCALGSARTFLVPLSSRPTGVGVVLVLGPIYNDTRLQVAKEIVRSHPGALLLVSVDDPVNNCQGMTAPGAEDVVCFRPEPFTTRGEAQAVGRLMHERHLESVLVVGPPDQLERARFLVRRCVDGPVLAVASPRPMSEVRGLFWYQNAAMVQAYLRLTC